MFIVRKPKEKINSVPIRQATIDEFLNYKNNCDIEVDDSTKEDYEKLLKQLIGHSQRIELLEKTVSANAQKRDSKICTVTLLASAWQGTTSPYSQVVTINDVTENSQVDLLPDAGPLAVFYEKDLTFVTENVSGIITVYAIGQKPENDYTIQAAVVEVL